MDLKELELLGEDQERHWYFVSKARALRRAIGSREPARILDVGAGSGFFSRALLRETSATSATCVDPGYTHERSESCAGKPLTFRRSAPEADADLVLVMDVLEHVDDDVALLRALVAPAAAGTRFVISVPAFMWLWSGHDVFLEHRRRYTLTRAVRVASEAGLAPTQTFYFFASIFPAAVVQRLWSRRRTTMSAPRSQLQRHHPAVNALLIRLCRWESAAALHNRLFGLTAFVVAEKT